MTADPFLVRRIARECVRVFGTGYRHGDLTISEETYERIVRFTLDQAEDMQQVAFDEDDR